MDFNFRLYPRGFIGGNLKPQVERTDKPYDKISRQHQYKVNEHTSSSDVIAPNPNIEALYSQYIKNSVNSNSTEFRKNLLVVALSAFGTNNFATWYFMQFKSPAASSLHNDFLTDTLRFIMHGSRHMSLETWMALLQITDEGNNIGNISELAKDFFKVQKNSNSLIAEDNYKLLDIIQMWCSKPNGLEDLLVTLHILFGNP
jgi:hypothetical protein